MKNNVVVFGGSGFLGSHVADMLTKSGYNVTIFDVINSKYINSDQKMVIGDINDKKLVENTISKNSIVYHFAAMADIKEAKDKAVDAVKFNILGTLIILEACRKYKIKRFVFSSSVYVYSDHGSIYRCTKQACELFIKNYNIE